MVAEKYGANVAALGEEAAHKLSKMCVAIYANGPVSQAAIYNLIGLGVGSIEHITTSDELPPGILNTLAKSLSPRPNRFEESLYYISPSLKYKRQLNPTHSTIALNIDANPNNNYNNVAQQAPIENIFLPRCTYEYSAHKAHHNTPKSYEITQSLLLGALFADEVRKRVSHISQFEQQLQNNNCLELDLAAILHKSANSLLPARLERVLVIGAGGIGTHCTYILASRKLKEIVLCEPDIIEETNLNRQLFYTGYVGDTKAHVLSARLSNNITKITPRKEFFTESFNAQGKLDAIFCCTDTLESRISASKYAQEHSIPLVEGACTPTMGCITTYIPGKTKSICEQRDLHSLLKIKQQTRKQNETQPDTSCCAKIANPSIIGPNVIIGTLQAVSLDKKYDSSGNYVEQYPQVFLNLLRNSKFSQGVTQ